MAILLVKAKTLRSNKKCHTPESTGKQQFYNTSKATYPVLTSATYKVLKNYT